MRKQFIEDITTLSEAMEIAPWASYVVKTDKGYLVFESADDYYNHLNQI